MIRLVVIVIVVFLIMLIVIVMVGKKVCADSILANTIRYQFK